MNNINEQTIRIANVFKSGTGLPRASEKTLVTYYRYLIERVTFPVVGTIHGKEIKIVHLSPVDDGGDIDEHYGLICEGKQEKEVKGFPLAEIEIKEKGENQELIEDYQTWFWDNR